MTRDRQPARGMTTTISSSYEGSVLDALIDSWRRNNIILVNLLRALLEGAMDLRATDGSPTAAQLFTHIHCCRLSFVQEDVRELVSADLRVSGARRPTATTSRPCSSRARHR
jgi:hypothetical protein